MQNVTPEQARTAARSLAIARIATGVVALVAPALLVRLWVGGTTERRAIRMLGRILGGREVALGVGALLALNHETPVRGWMEAASLADGVDCLVTASRFRSLPRFRRWVFLLGAASAASAEAAVARAVDVSA